MGTPINPSDFRRDLHNLCTKAGINFCNPNQLRHSFASIVSSKGVALEEIADAMGHVDTGMTSLVYRHRLNPVVTSAADPWRSYPGVNAAGDSAVRRDGIQSAPNL